MLLIVIASLVFALVVQQRRAARQQAELKDQLRLVDEQLLDIYVQFHQYITVSRQRSIELMRLYRELELMKEGHIHPLGSSSIESLRRARRSGKKGTEIIIRINYLRPLFPVQTFYN